VVGALEIAQFHFKKDGGHGDLDGKAAFVTAKQSSNTFMIKERDGIVRKSFTDMRCMAINFKYYLLSLGKNGGGKTVRGAL